MPIPLLFMALIVLIGLSIINFASKEYKIGVVLFISSVLLSAWIGAAYRDVSCVEGTAKVSMVDNIAVANIGGDVVNLNQRFRKQFVEGQIVKYKKYDEFSYGILILIETQMEIE